MLGDAAGSGRETEDWQWMLGGCSKVAMVARPCYRTRSEWLFRLEYFHAKSATQGVCATQLLGPAPDYWFEVYVDYEKRVYAGLT
jgi:hypothetical protein